MQPTLTFAELNDQNVNVNLYLQHFSAVSKFPTVLKNHEES